MQLLRRRDGATVTINMAIKTTTRIEIGTETMTVAVTPIMTETRCAPGIAIIATTSRLGWLNVTGCRPALKGS